MCMEYEVKQIVMVDKNSSQTSLGDLLHLQTAPTMNESVYNKLINSCSSLQIGVIITYNMHLAIWLKFLATKPIIKS